MPIPSAAYLTGLGVESNSSIEFRQDKSVRNSDAFSFSSCRKLLPVTTLILQERDRKERDGERQMTHSEIIFLLARLVCLLF